MSPRISKPVRILLLGAPGAGKGTYATRLSKLWSLPHVCTGEVIRKEIATGSPLGRKFKEFSDKGLLVPDDVVNDISAKRLGMPDVQEFGYILDGYPRTVAQAKFLQSKMPPHLCVNMYLPEDILVQTISGRRVCIACNATYNVAAIENEKYHMPPLLPDATNSKCKCTDLFQRADDQASVVIERLRIYNECTKPLLDFYSSLGILRQFEPCRGVRDLPKFTALLNDFFGEESSTVASEG